MKVNQALSKPFFQINWASQSSIIWPRTSGFFLSPKKSRCIIFIKKHKHNSININMDGNQISYSNKNSMYYFWQKIIMVSTHKFHKKFSISINQYNNIFFHSTWNSKTHILTQFYKTHTLSKVDYGVYLVWCRQINNQKTRRYLQLWA